MSKVCAEREDDWTEENGVTNCDIAVHHVTPH